MVHVCVALWKRFRSCQTRKIEVQDQFSWQPVAALNLRHDFITASGHSRKLKAQQTSICSVIERNSLRQREQVLLALAPREGRRLNIVIALIKLPPRRTTTDQSPLTDNRSTLINSNYADKQVCNNILSRWDRQVLWRC